MYVCVYVYKYITKSDAYQDVALVAGEDREVEGHLPFALVRQYREGPAAALCIFNIICRCEVCER